MDPTDDLFDHYVAIGALKEGFDEHNNIVYFLTDDAETIAPELYRRWMRQVEDEVIELLDAGYVDITFSDEGEPLYSLTDLGREYALGHLSE